MDLFDKLGSYAFPALVCCYLLWERRTGYHELKRAVYALVEQVQEIATTIRERLKP